jgi:hypothetical protein
MFKLKPRLAASLALVAFVGIDGAILPSQSSEAYFTDQISTSNSTTATALPTNINLRVASNNGSNVTVSWDDARTFFWASNNGLTRTTGVTYYLARSNDGFVSNSTRIYTGQAFTYSDTSAPTSGKLSYRIIYTYKTWQALDYNTLVIRA